MDYRRGLLKKTADVVVMEKCPLSIDKYVAKILKSTSYYKYDDLREFIDRVNFQIIFTLAVIQKKYPSHELYQFYRN